MKSCTREIWTFWKGLERCYSFQKCFFIARGKSTKWMSVIASGQNAFHQTRTIVFLHFIHLQSAIWRKYGACMYTIHTSTRAFILNWLACSGNKVNRSTSNGANLSDAFVCSNRPLWELNVMFLMLTVTMLKNLACAV